MANVWVELDRTGARMVIRSPFKKEFVDQLKLRVPYMNREWDGTKKVWAVDREYWSSAKSVIETHFGEGSITYGPAAEAALVEKMIDDLKDPDMLAFQVLGIRADAPLCVVHAAYRAIEQGLLSPPNPETLDLVGRMPLGPTRMAYEQICKLKGAEPWKRICW